MDADQIKKMDQQYDGSVNSEYSLIGGNRKETFNIRTNRHYGFRVASGPVNDPMCAHCKSLISGHKFVYNGRVFHYDCAFKS
jgi:hypothetical protein